MALGVSRFVRLPVPGWALLLGVAACDRTPAPERPTSLGSALRSSCVDLGPASCERPPSTSAGLCESLAGCVHDASGNLNLEGLVFDCKREPFGAAPETAFTKSAAAPVRSGVSATSIVNVVASENDAMRFMASYLVAELGEGLCIVDGVLPWGGAHADTEYSMRWEPAAGAPTRLHVRAHRVTYTVLDQDELARGESNVVNDVCALRSYEVVAGRFTRVSHNETDGQCPALP